MKTITLDCLSWTNKKKKKSNFLKMWYDRVSGNTTFIFVGLICLSHIYSTGVPGGQLAFCNLSVFAGESPHLRDACHIENMALTKSSKTHFAAHNSLADVNWSSVLSPYWKRTNHSESDVVTKLFPQQYMNICNIVIIITYPSLNSKMHF